MFRIRISRDALADIQQSGDYIAREKGSPWTAERLIEGIYDTIAGLCLFPYKYALDEDPLLAAAGIRKCHYKNYRIYYVINTTEQRIRILRVLHILTDARPHLIPQ